MTSSIVDVVFLQCALWGAAMMIIAVLAIIWYSKDRCTLCRSCKKIGKVFVCFNLRSELYDQNVLAINSCEYFQQKNRGK